VANGPKRGQHEDRHEEQNDSGPRDAIAYTYGDEPFVVGRHPPIQ